MAHNGQGLTDATPPGLLQRRIGHQLQMIGDVSLDGRSAAEASYGSPGVIRRLLFILYLY